VPRVALPRQNTRDFTPVFINNEPPCSKLQVIKVDSIFSPHPNPLPKERELVGDPVASYRELPS